MAARGNKKITVDSVFNDTEPAWTENKKEFPEKSTWDIVKDAFKVGFTLSLDLL